MPAVVSVYIGPVHRHRGIRNAGAEALPSICAYLHVLCAQSCSRDVIVLYFSRTLDIVGQYHAMTFVIEITCGKRPHPLYFHKVVSSLII